MQNDPYYLVSKDCLPLLRPLACELYNLGERMVDLSHLGRVLAYRHKRLKELMNEAELLSLPSDAKALLEKIDLAIEEYDDIKGLKDLRKKVLAISKGNIL